jgi:hypothetical protein
MMAIGELSNKLSVFRVFFGLSTAAYATFPLAPRLFPIWDELSATGSTL